MLDSKKAFLWTMSIIATLLVSLLTWGTSASANWVGNFVQRVNTLETQQQQQIRTTQDMLHKIIINMNTIMGKGHVQSNGMSDSCLRVNLVSKAKGYVDYKEAKVTNLSDLDTPSAVIKISGTFRNPDPDYLVELSSSAGRLISVEGDEFDVLIEPVE